MGRWWIGVLAALVCMVPAVAEAGLWFHATKKAAAGRIMRSGLSVRKMSAKSRFGRGEYASKTMSTALREKPKAQSVVVFRANRGLKPRLVDLRRASPSRLKALSGARDLRGTVKKRIIGPKLGRKLGRNAGREGKAVLYRSAKDPRKTNLFIPRQTGRRERNLLKPVRVVPR